MLSDHEAELAKASDAERRVRLLAEQPDRQRATGRGRRGVAAATPNTLVIVDEAYVEFGGKTALPLVTEHPNVAVVRTFSKAFALAGARLGYVLADDAVVADLQRVRLPYHLSALSQAAGMAALRAPRRGARRCSRTSARSATASWRGWARSPGLTVFPSDANFVLFVPPRRDAVAVWQASARPRRARARPDRGGAERAARHRRGRARGRPVPARPSRRCCPHDPHREPSSARRRRRPTSPSSSSSTGRGSSTRRHRHPVLRPHAAAARQARRVGPGRHLHGRPAGRRPPHRRGLRHRAGHSDGGGARRQGGHPPVRVDHRAARRGGGRGLRSTSRGGTSSCTRCPCRTRRSTGSTPACSRTSCARSRRRPN